MSDAFIRERTADIPIFEFEQTSFVRPPALEQATVAIVTTAGLQRAYEEGWKHGDERYRVFSSDEGNLRCGHLSPNFDRTGMVADLNVVYPLDRLRKMADEGVIGGVSPKHVSFMGALDETMTTVRLESGPAAAQELLDAGADVAILTPV